MRAKVAIIRTTPGTVLADIRRLMKLADVASALKPGTTTILKNNLSWHIMYPSANTTPWQLEGTILGLQDAGLSDLVCVENRTVVTSAKKGEILNKQRPVCEYYDVSIKYNFNKYDMQWKVYQPKSPMLVLDKVFPKGIKIPDFFPGKNVVHLPTTKCHIYTNITGSIIPVSDLSVVSFSSSKKSARSINSGPTCPLCSPVCRISEAASEIRFVARNVALMSPPCDTDSAATPKSAA